MKIPMPGVGSRLTRPAFGDLSILLKIPAIAILAAVAIALFVDNFLIVNAQIPSGSMVRINYQNH